MALQTVILNEKAWWGVWILLWCVSVLIFNEKCDPQSEFKVHLNPSWGNIPMANCSFQLQSAKKRNVL